MTEQNWSAARIRRLRGEASRAEFARRLGVSALTVYRWELPDDAVESRRPRGKVAQKLDRYSRGERVAESFAVPRAMGDLLQPDELRSVFPLLERLNQGDFRRVEAELLKLLASGQFPSVNGRALATQALARIHLWARADVQGAFTLMVPLLAEADSGRLSPVVELEVHLTAALTFAGLDGRFFDPGKTNTHIARAERLLEAGATTSEAVPRFLIWLAQVSAAYVLNDPALIAVAVARMGAVAQDLTSPLFRCYAEEISAIAAQLSGNAAATVVHLGELVRQAETGAFHLVRARALSQAVRAAVDEGDEPERVLASIEAVETVLREGRIVPGWHSMFLAYAKAEVLYRQGRFAECESALREGLLINEAISWSPGTLPFFLMRLLLVTGRVTDLVAVGQQLSSYQSSVFPAVTRHLGSVAKALVDVVEGKSSPEAIDHLDEATRELEAVGAWSYLRRNMLLLNAAVAVFAGDARQGDRAVRRAERGLDLLPAVYAHATLAWLKAVRALRLGRASEASDLARNALAPLERAKDRLTTALATRTLAAALARSDPPKASELLAESDAELTALGFGGTAWFDQVLARSLDSGPKERPRETSSGDASLNALALLVSRLSVRGLRPAMLQRELLACARELLPGCPLRLDEVDSKGEARPVLGDASASLDDWVEFGDGTGRRFRLGASQSDRASSHALLTMLAQVGGLAMEVAGLRGLSERPVASTPFDGEIPDIPGFVSASVAIRRLKADLARLSRSRSTVIVTGESGSGKEVVARAIHYLSTRAGRPYVAFNCAAVPRDLFEGQLFGYRKGAFTGATSDHAGVVRAADGGTLFLDEIGELPLDVQPKLLRFLENGEVFPLGERKPIRVDVRVVAATFRELEKLVRDGRFREDLFYRLQVVPLRVPPLRERPEDVVVLARHFIKQFTPTGQEPPVLAPDAVATLVAHAWPGNVRELRNVIERSLAFEPLPSLLTADQLRLS